MTDAPDPAPDLDAIEADMKAIADARLHGSRADGTPNQYLHGFVVEAWNRRPENSGLALIALARHQAEEREKDRAEIAKLEAEVDRLEARIESIVDRQT